MPEYRRFQPRWVVHEDSELLLVAKPAGLLTHASADKSRLNLVDLLRQARPELSGLTLQHRLDRETSGLLLFTLGDALRAPVAQACAQRQVHKEYLCWVRGKRLNASWTVQAPLQQRSGRVSVGPGQEACTEFTLLRRQGSYCLLQARPLSGRKHQIRVHLAHQRLPIVGDTLYGGEPADRLLLHAHRLELDLPGHGGLRSWTAPPEADFTPPV